MYASSTRRLRARRICIIVNHVVFLTTARREETTHSQHFVFVLANKLFALYSPDFVYGELSCHRALLERWLEPRILSELTNQILVFRAKSGIFIYVLYINGNWVSRALFWYTDNLNLLYLKCIFATTLIHRCLCNRQEREKAAIDICLQQIFEYTTNRFSIFLSYRRRLQCQSAISFPFRARI